MESIGVVRQLDKLGRAVIPIEIRRRHQIDIGDALEIFVDKEKIVLKKYVPACIFCGDAKDIRRFSDKNICLSCRDKLIEAKL